jgi:hypothetical protein
VELNEELATELQEYFQMRYERCKHNLDLIGDTPNYMAWLKLCWERDFFREKCLKLLS